MALHSINATMKHPRPFDYASIKCNSICWWITAQVKWESEVRVAHLSLSTLRMAALVDHLSLITNLLIEANGFSAIFYRQQEEGRRMRPTRNYLCQQVCSFHYSAPQGKICLLRGILVVTEECLLAVLFNRSFLHSLTQPGDVNHELM